MILMRIYISVICNRITRIAYNKDDHISGLNVSIIYISRPSACIGLSVSLNVPWLNRIMLQTFGIVSLANHVRTKSNRFLSDSYNTRIKFNMVKENNDMYVKSQTRIIVQVIPIAKSHNDPYFLAMDNHICNTVVSGLHQSMASYDHM